MKQGQRHHKAGYRHWRGDQPAQFRPKTEEMSEVMRERIALRLHHKTGWVLEHGAELRESENAGLT